jgi:hypothetical protein
MADPSFPETTFSLSEDGTLATIRLGAEAIVADAASLEDLIGHLGLLRSRMQPEVPAELVPEARYLQIDGAAMTVAESEDRQSVGFLFRTPTYGWIACGLPLPQAVAMGRHLVATFGGRAASSAND